MNNKQLYVVYDKQLVGVLVEDRYGVFSFEYDYKWIMNPKAFAISISLPLPDSQPKGIDQRQKEVSSYLTSLKYTGDPVKSYFSGLLPEGEVLEKVAERLSVSQGSSFKLLEALGGDCAGALVLTQEYTDKFPSEKLSVTLDELEKILEGWRIKPFSTDEDSEARRMSLAGAQYKMPIIFEDGEYFQPNGAPSTHIIKLPIPDIEHSVENEALCLTLARLIGIHTVFVKIVKIGNVNYLLVDRYDRIRSETGWKRLHQEDMCQALAIPSEYKYQKSRNPNKNTPSVHKIASLIKDNCKNPMEDITSFIKQFIFSFFIKNRDAHGKNYSFLYEGRDVKLAPLYDVLNTEIYKKPDGENLYSNEMAMKLGSTYNAENVRIKDWEKFAEDLGVSFSLVNDIRQEILEGMKSKIDTAIRELFATDSMPETIQSMRDDIQSLK